MQPAGQGRQDIQQHHRGEQPGRGHQGPQGEPRPLPQQRGARQTDTRR
jgi:hypothetical protein